MSYSLLPVVVDLARVQALMGSKDAAVLQAVIKARRKDMLEIDEIVGDFDEDGPAIRKEYKAFAAGDFSGVNLAAVYDEPEEEEPDPEDENFARAYKAAKTEAERKQLMEAFFKKAVEEFSLDDDDEDEESDGRVLTTGAALAHLILGGNLDPSAWSQYGYAFQFLCEHLGTVPAEYDSWASIRSETFDAADRVLKTAGVPPGVFAANAFLVERGPPVPILTPDDFPYVGFVRRAEVGEARRYLDSPEVEAAAKASRADDGWAAGAFAELRGWLKAAAEADRDLVTFYR